VTGRNASLIVLLGFGLAQSADARDAPVPLKEVVTEAQSIFVGKVLEVSPVEFEFDGRKHNCGFRYRARIEQAFKGPAQAVEFFDPSSDGPLAQNAAKR
jgi:hypothetical protein